MANYFKKMPASLDQGLMEIRPVGGGRYCDFIELCNSIASLAEDAEEQYMNEDNLTMGGAAYTLTIKGKDGSVVVALRYADDNILDGDDYDKVDFAVVATTHEFDTIIQKIERFLLSY